MRARRLLAALACAGTALAVPALTAPAAGAATTVTSAETTIGYSALRQNWDAGEPGLTSLTASGIRALWTGSVGTSAAAPNQIYAQPLVADKRVIVVTDDNQVAAFTPGGGRRLWSVNLGPGWTPTPTCGDLTPHIGITSTPVYDTATHTVYLIAKAADGPAGRPTVKIHAIDATTGRERTGWPVTVAGTSTNGGQTFDPSTSNQRPGLLLGDDGALYFGTASHCDNGPFVGFVGRLALATRSLKLWTTEADDANGQAGIWQSGGGIMSDGDDSAGHPRLFVATGNGLGVSPKPGAGSSPPSALAESVVRLHVESDGSMSAADFFSPTNNYRLDQDDADLGSGGPVALPASFGSGAHPHLLVIVGKDGIVRLLDRDDLGGVAQGTNPAGSDDVVSSLAGNGVWGHPAAFDGGAGRRYLYLAPSGSPLQAMAVSPDAAANPTLSAVAASTETYGFGTGSPVVTSDGSDPSTALVWLVKRDAADGGQGTLEAYPAIPPTSGDWKPVLSFPLGPVAKFVQPATAGGRVFVGTLDGRLLAFGAGTTSPVTVPPTDFGLVPVGQNSSQTVTVTAQSAVTITKAVTSAGFTLDPSAAASLPVTLAAGQQVSTTITFAPTAATVTSGTLTLTTDTGTFAFSLRGTGASDGIAATPSSVAFGAVAVGQSAIRGVTIRNTGTTATTVTVPPAFTGASPDPFTLTSAAVPQGFVIPKQGSVTVVVRVAPTAPGALSDTLTMSTSTGTVSVPLSANGYTGQPVLSLTQTALDYGNVAPGATGVGSYQVHNVGSATMAVTKAPLPAPPFSVPSPLPEGETIEPGGSAYVQIFVRPLSAMPHTDVSSVSIGATANGNPPPAGNSPQSVQLSVNTRPWTGAITGRYGCVTASGSAVTDGGCGSATGFTRSSDGRLHVGDVSSTPCLAVTGAATRAGSPVTVTTCSSAAGQTWRIPAAGTLVDAHSGLCLRPKGGSTAVGAALVVDTCTTSVAQRWDLSALLSARGLVSSGLGSLGGYCLSDRADSRRAGTPMVLAGCSFATGQIITHVSNTLKVLGGCLSVQTAKPGAAVTLQPCTGTGAQVWTADSTNRLYNPASGLCLDVPSDSTASGPALAMASCDPSRPGQQWTLPDTAAS